MNYLNSFFTSSFFYFHWWEWGTSPPVPSTVGYSGETNTQSGCWKRSWQLIWPITQLLCFSCSQQHLHKETCRGWVGANWIWPLESRRGLPQPVRPANVLFSLIERCPFDLALHLHPPSNGLRLWRNPDELHAHGWEKNRRVPLMFFEMAKIFFCPMAKCAVLHPWLNEWITTWLWVYRSTWRGLAVRVAFVNQRAENLQCFLFTAWTAPLMNCFLLYVWS